MDEPEMRIFKPHPLRWVVEPLQDEPSYLEKAMFGCRGCYLHGRLVLVLASRGKEPWKGLLVPTEKKHHGALQVELPDLGVLNVEVEAEGESRKWEELKASGKLRLVNSIFML